MSKFWTRWDHSSLLRRFDAEVMDIWHPHFNLLVYFLVVLRARAHWNWCAWVHLALSKKNLIGSYKRTRLSRLLCHKGKISVQKQKLVLVLDWHANRLSSLLDGWDAARNEERLYMQVSLVFAGRWNLAAEGTHNPERATPILGLCHGVFTDQFILRHILGHLFPRK